MRCDESIGDLQDTARGRPARDQQSQSCRHRYPDCLQKNYGGQHRVAVLCERAIPRSHVHPLRFHRNANRELAQGPFMSLLLLQYAGFAVRQALA